MLEEAVKLESEAAERHAKAARIVRHCVLDLIKQKCFVGPVIENA